MEQGKLQPSLRYRFCNHHHELTEDHQIVNFGDGEFVANKMAIPLLQALNELGLRTRTHHVDESGGFVSILLYPHIRLEVKTVNEIAADRSKYNGLTEALISWRKPQPEIEEPEDDTDLLLSIGKAGVITGYKCKICGSEGPFDDFPKHISHTEYGKEVDTFCKNPGCEGQNEDLEERIEFYDERSEATDDVINRLIQSITIFPGNLEHIAATGKINGSLLQDLRRIMVELVEWCKQQEGTK